MTFIRGVRQREVVVSLAPTNSGAYANGIYMTRSISSSGDILLSPQSLDRYPPESPSVLVDQDSRLQNDS